MVANITFWSLVHHSCPLPPHKYTTNTHRQANTNTYNLSPARYVCFPLSPPGVHVCPPFHLTWTSASSESDQDRTRIWSSAFLLQGIYNYSQYGVVQIRRDFPLNLGYVVAICALPEYPFLLPNFPRNDMLCIFPFFEPQLSLWNKFLPRKRRLGGCSAHLATTVWFLLG